MSQDEQGSISGGNGPTLSQKPKPVIQGRLTVNDQVFVQFPGEPVEDCSFGHSIVLLNAQDDDQQTYTRRASAGPDWKPINLGHVERTSSVAIKNTQCLDSQSIHSEEEVANLNAHIIWVRFANDDSWWELKPGESMRGNPKGQLEICCPHGKCRYTVLAIPE